VEADEVWAHNAMFDRERDRQAPARVRAAAGALALHDGAALSHSLPGGLDKLCDIVQVPLDKAKHKDGKELIKLFCKPRPVNAKIRRATRETHPAEWQRFLEYAGNDIEAMRQIGTKLPDWNYKGAELALWHLDQRINDRGFAVDLELAESAVATAAKEQERLAHVAQEMTDGAVMRATQRDALLEYILAEHNLRWTDLKGSTLERLLASDEIPDVLKELLRVRLQASTTSTSKYKRVVNGATGGRLRGTLQFNGAGRTGRWAGRTFQPQNLPRPSMPAEEVEVGIERDQGRRGRPGLRQRHAADQQRDPRLHRGAAGAQAGDRRPVQHRGPDARLAGRRGVEAAGVPRVRRGHRRGPLQAGLCQGVPHRRGRRHKEQRQIGKVMELMLGYEGGVGAFLTGAATYGFDVEDLGVRAYDTIPAHILHEAGRSTTGPCSRSAPPSASRAPRSWCATRSSACGARRTRTCSRCGRSWSHLHRGRGRTRAPRSPAATSRCAATAPGCASACPPAAPVLPAAEGGGRKALVHGREPVHAPVGADQDLRRQAGGERHPGRRARRAGLAHARHRGGGYEIVLSVHDELITEAPTPERNVAELSVFMATPPAWAPDLPLAAAGFETYRYRKD
jgi:DNA polymerase